MATQETEVCVLSFECSGKSKIDVKCCLLTSYVIAFASQRAKCCEKTWWIQHVSMLTTEKSEKILCPDISSVISSWTYNTQSLTDGLFKARGQFLSFWSVFFLAPKHILSSRQPALYLIKLHCDLILQILEYLSFFWVFNFFSLADT